MEAFSVITEETYKEAEEVFVFPASIAQNRFWLLHQMELGSSALNMPLAMQLSGSLNMPALERSLAEIVGRHEALRTTLAVVDGKLSQVIAPELEITLERTDLRDADTSIRESESRRIIAEEACRPFDLASGPLLRTRLLMMGAAENVLLMTMHHVVCDGWSNGVLVRELADLYEAFSQDRPSPLSELPIQYADYACWQQEWLQSAAFEEDLSYWKQRLGGKLPVLDIPTDRPRTEGRNSPGNILTLLLPESLINALKALSGHEDVTLFMMFLAAFKTLLYRYTGQADLLVGSPVANRNQVEVEGLIGLFANPVALRTDLTGDPSFRDLLHRVRDVALEAYAHQNFPFEKLVEEVHQQQDRGRTPLLQAFFIYQKAFMQSRRAGGVTFAPLRSVSGGSAFDMTFSVVRRSEGHRVQIEYNTDLFDTATINRMLEHYYILLKGIVADPESRISSLPLLTEAERRFVTTDRDGDPVALPLEITVCQLLEAQAQDTPDAAAVMCDAAQLTYGDLNSRANQLARYLRKRGAGPDTRVGIRLDRSVEMAAAVLAVLKSGATCVPLSMDYSNERLLSILSATGASIIVTRRASMPVSFTNQELVCLDTDRSLIAVEDGSNPEWKPSPDTAACVVYTSGRTGAPKPVLVTHRALASRSRALVSEFGLTRDDRILQFASIGSAASLEEMFPAWITGACVILRSDETLNPTSEFLGRLGAQRITVASLPASFWLSLMRVLCVDQKRLLPETLRLVSVWGERASHKACLAWMRRVESNIRLLCCYGTAETGMTSAVYEPRVDEGSQVGSSVPIGRPLGDTQLYLLDGNLVPAPIGVPGELYVGGSFISEGYSSEPESTPRSSIKNPIQGRSQSGLFKTGDLAVYAADGSIRLLGRINEQIKLHGLRVDTSVIDSEVTSHPDVLDSITLGAENQAGRTEVRTWVVTTADVDSVELTNFLRRRLPPSLVPSTIVPLEGWPLNADNLVDRRELISSDPGLSSAEHRKEETKGDASVDALELRLTEIWESVLGVSSIAATDNFFELGGHSLLAVSLFAQIDKELGMNLPLSILFEAPTVEEMAKVLRESGASRSWSSLVPINPDGSKTPFFCVHAAGGNVLFYRDLSRRLGPEQPFYGLQPEGLDGKGSRHTRIEEMVGHYIDAIRTAQPHGPYYLGGASFGGTVAFEIARQLREQGESVALVALFDTYGPGYPKAMPGRSLLRNKLSDLLFRIEHHIGSLRMLSPNERLTYVLEKIYKARRRLIRLKVNSKKAIRRRRYSWFGRPLPESLLKTQDAIAEAARRYEAKVYDGRVVLLRANRQPSGIYPDPTLGWGPWVTGELNVHEVPGFHGAIVMEPRVKFVVQELTRYLEGAEAEPERANHSLWAQERPPSATQVDAVL